MHKAGIKNSPSDLTIAANPTEIKLIEIKYLFF